MKQSRPWEQPGFRFTPTWPPGFTPSIDWDTKASQHREASVRGRQTALAKGNTGTLPGRALSQRSKDMARSVQVGQAMVERARKGRAG